MKLSSVLIALAAAALISPAYAQQTSTSTSGAVSGSSSASQAVGGTAAATNAGNSQSAANTVNVISPANQTVRTAPALAAPGLTTTLTETCMGSTSIGVSVVGVAATGGTTWNDGECVRRLNARELNAMGFHTEACYLLRVDKDVDSAFLRSGNRCDNWTTPTAMNNQQSPSAQADQTARPPTPPATSSAPSGQVQGAVLAPPGGAADHVPAVDTPALVASNDPRPSGQIYLASARAKLRSENYYGAMDDAVTAEATSVRGEALGLDCRARAIGAVGLKQAISVCDAAVEASPEAAEALLSRGLLDLRRYHWIAAREDLTHALRAQPDDPEALLALAVAAHNLGDAATAHDLSARALSMDPRIEIQFARWKFQTLSE